tara:strand:+ start:104 stop:412 length:309 start_codon:yes stop_codon:yes gene_type:complete
MVITNKNRFNKKYKQPLNKANGKDDISRLTGIPISILDQVYYRGMGAYRSPSGGKAKSVRPSVKSPQQWAMARVYSFVMKGTTWRTADKDLAEKVKKKKEIV